MNLAEFLTARLDDEEALARDAASEGTPSRTGWQLWTSKVDTTPGGERLGPRGSVEASPARVLADVAAKRAIVALEQYAYDDNTYRYCLRLLAQPFAGHPDYREEWKP